MNSMIDKFRNKIRYQELQPLIYSEGLKDSYMGSSVAGGSLMGRHVLVTGGASGIGLAIARRFLVEGCNVIISGRNEEKLKSAVKYLKSKNNGNIDYVVMDQCNSDSIKRSMLILFSQNGKIDILVNNAGVFTEVDKKRMFRNVSKEQYLDVIDTNMKGTALIAKLIAEKMFETNTAGNIINIASICALQRNFQYTPYGISKAAVIELTKQLSHCYCNKRVIVNGIAPGSVATSMGNFNTDDNIAKNCNVLNHPALPEEIAALAALLASNVGCYMSGKTIIASSCEVL